jgi:hypothetical protein
MAIAVRALGGSAGSGGFFGLGSGSGGWFGMGGMSGINGILALNNVVLSTTPIPQFQGGLEVHDSAGTSQVLIANDGTDVTFTKATSDDPRILSTLPYHVVLEGTDAPLDIAGVYPNGLIYARWEYDQSTASSGSVQAYGVFADMHWNSTDTVTGFTSGVTGVYSKVAVSKEMGTVAFPTLTGIDSRVSPPAGTAGSNAWNIAGIRSTITGNVKQDASGVTGAFVSLNSCKVEVNPTGDCSGVYVNGLHSFLTGVVDNYKTLNVAARCFATVGGVVTNDYGLYITDGSQATNSYGIWLETTEGIFFRDSALSINSATDGHIDIDADVSIDFNTPALVATSASLEVENIGLAGIAPTATAPIDISTLTSSSYLALIFADLEYTGTGGDVGSFQVGMLYSGTNANPNAYGSKFFANLGDTGTGSYAIAECWGARLDSGYEDNTTVCTGGFNVFYGTDVQVLGTGNIGGSHLSTPTVLAYGHLIRAMSTPTGVNLVKFGVLSLENVEVAADVNIGFDGGILANSDTYLVYDSASSTLDGFIDGTQWLDVGSAGTIGLGGSDAASNAVINFDETSSSLRGSLNFILDYTGASVCSNINSTLTNNATQASPTIYNQFISMIHSADSSGTANVYGVSNTLTLDSMAFTQGTHVLRGSRYQFTDNSSSNTGGDFRRKAIEVSSFGTLTGVTSDLVWGIDSAEPIVLRDDVSLVLGGSTTTQNTTNTITYNSANSEVDVAGDVNFDSEVKGTRTTLMFGDGGTLTTKYCKAINGQVLTATLGHCMPRAGSITALGATLNCTLGAISSDMAIAVKVNGTTALSVTIGTTSSGNKKGNTTAARGTHTFVAGDVLSGYMTKTGLSTQEDLQAIYEVTFDD